MHDQTSIVDGIDDKAMRSYEAWPDRLYLIGKDGKVAYKGGPGPFQFKPDELEAAIAKELKPKPKTKTADPR